MKNAEDSIIPSGMLSRRRFIGSAAWFAAMPPFAAVAGADAAKPGTAPRRSKPRNDSRAAFRAIYETPDGRAADSIWCRRAYLDIAGRIPTPDEAKAFAADTSPDKRTRLADALFDSDDFADYWSMRLCDILRVKSEFPVNLWPNAVYVYHRRIRESVASGESWLEFARKVLTASGSNFRDPETNFLRASADRTAEGLSEAASLAFLGSPTKEFASYFRPVRFKPTREWKEEIVYFEPSAAGPADFAKRLETDLEERFAAAQAQRVHEWIFCSPPDATARKRLAAGFKACGYRLKPFLRDIVLSDAYAQGSVTGGFPVRRLDAEVLDDAICSITGSAREYKSIAPEPFTFLPPERKSVLIEDGSISSAFLILFGRPARDSGEMSERHNGTTAKQRLYLFNSGRLYGRIARVTDNKRFHSRPYRAMFADLYWRFLSRPPARIELDRLDRQMRIAKKISGQAQWRMPKDVAWCLLNSKEFLFRT